MKEKTSPIFDSLNTMRQNSNEFFILIRSWQRAEVEDLTPERKDFVQAQTMRMVFACMDVLTHINPGFKVTLTVKGKEPV